MLYKEVKKHIDDHLDVSSLSDYVRQEVDKFIDNVKGLKEGEDLVYFNNFQHNLPNSAHPITRQAYDLSEEEFNEAWGDLAPQFRGTLDQKIEDERCSKVMRSQTYRKFYQTVDRVLEEVGVYDKVAKLMKEKPERWRTEVKLEASPAFFKLLKMGYNIYPDLIA